VKAITADGLESENIAEYSFTIATPFHKTKWFLLLLILSLILTGIAIQLFINKAKRRKELQLNLLRQEEQEKVKQRTSEDFHDELGNKLTRILLLADILQKKAGPADTEKTGLINQIKDNVQLLYTGTKDVIWSLSPGSDNLLEILKRIEQFGTELFHDSAIDFSMEGLNEIDPETKLPIDYSRNIIMIFKELLNNCLRHAKATKVSITVLPAENDQLLITQADNGTGYDAQTIKKGNGLTNIQRRAERIGAALEIASGQSKGTTVKLKIKIPPNGGWN
jgi:signal transduction histidine kinase